jgi:predicted ArsR family transcriptional regulator
MASATSPRPRPTSPGKPAADASSETTIETQIQGLTETRLQILAHLKKQREATTRDISAALKVSYEAVRQHLVQLERDGWIKRSTDRNPEAGAGRPLARFELTAAADHLFPKHYDALAVEMVDAIADHLGADALREVLTALTDARVRKWEPQLKGKSLRERVDALRDIYLQDDPFTAVESDGAGLRLVERNCPFLNIALRRPALCSVTVSALTRLLGVRVEREECFQKGDRCCAFRVLAGEPADEIPFHFEDESGSVPAPRSIPAAPS